MNTIRIIHNLPRSGGTIISKCLGAQKDVVLLSEIHPEGIEIRKTMKVKAFYGDPIFQAQEWNNLFDKNDKENICNLNYNFEKKIDLIFEKTASLNKKLIIRDWAFVDYFGKPFISPTYKNSLLNLLNKKYKVLNFHILRHPLELYVSCFKSLNFFREHYKFEFFLKGYRNFFLDAIKGNVYKYENFLLKPEKFLINMCDVLDIEYDNNYLTKLKNVRLTGDNKAINSMEIYNKKNVAQNLIKKEDKDKIYNHVEFIKLMHDLRDYY